MTNHIEIDVAEVAARGLKSDRQLLQISKIEIRALCMFVVRECSTPETEEADQNANPN